MDGKDGKNLKQFLEKFGAGLKQNKKAADNKTIVKATYSFDIDDPNIGQPSGDPFAIVYLNDEEIGRISFTGDPGEPLSKTIEVDVTDKIVSGDYNAFTLGTIVLKDLFGFKFSSEAEFSIRHQGKKLAKEEYKTKTEIRSVQDTWAFYVQ